MWRRLIPCVLPAVLGWLLPSCGLIRTPFRVAGAVIDHSYRAGKAVAKKTAKTLSGDPAKKDPKNDPKKDPDQNTAGANQSKPATGAELPAGPPGELPGELPPGPPAQLPGELPPGRPGELPAELPPINPNDTLPPLPEDLPPLCAAS